MGEAFGVLTIVRGEPYELNNMPNQELVLRDRTQIGTWRSVQWFFSSNLTHITGSSINPIITWTQLTRTVSLSISWYRLER